jgi:hypothetical protein
MSVAVASHLPAQEAQTSDRSDVVVRGRRFDALVRIPAAAGDGCDRAAVVAVEAAQRLRAVLECGRPHQPPGLVILELRMARQPDGVWVAKARRIDDPAPRARSASRSS